MIAVLRWMAAAACLAGAAVSAVYALRLSGAEVGLAPGLFVYSSLDRRCAEEGAACSADAFGRLALQAPLNGRALSGLLAQQYEVGLAAEDSRLAELVLSRDPRSELARVVLAEGALKAGETERFLALYLPLFRTDPRQAQVYADTLAALSRDPALFASLSAYILENRPVWGRLYLRALAIEDGVSTQTKIALYAEYPEVQSALLSRLLADGNWPGAYIVFTELVSSGALARADSPLPLAVPFNARLQANEAPAPFAWTLHGGAAEYMEEGGVYAFYQGRRAEKVLSQTIPLAAGNWRFGARMSGQLSENGGRFRWTLACAGTGTQLASYEVRELGAVASDQFFDVSVPPGTCGFATLTLEGVSGMFPQPARIEVREVSLFRLAAETTGP